MNSLSVENWRQLYSCFVKLLGLLLNLPLINHNFFIVLCNLLDFNKYNQIYFSIEFNYPDSQGISM